MAKQKKQVKDRAIGFISQEAETAYYAGDYYLLVIGINQYSPNYQNLENAVGDAIGLAKVLETNYKFKKITRLINEQATRFNILKTLEDYETLLNENDNLLIFFAGHGYAKDPLGYIIPVDAPADTKIGFIPYSNIIEQFRLIAARHILLIVDSCYAGYLVNYRGESDKSKVTIELEEKLKSRKFLTSGYKEKVPDGPVGGNSPFIKSFLNILKSNDQAKLSINSLFQKIKDEIKSIPQMYKTPTPMYHELISVGDEGGSMVLYLENVENEETRAYKRAISLRTRQALEYFLNEFKNSNYRIEVKTIFQAEYAQQEKEWDIARQIKTVNRIGSYLNKYPNEFFSSVASIELLKIEDLIETTKPLLDKALALKNIADRDMEANEALKDEETDKLIFAKYREAIGYLTEAIKIYPDFEDAYYVRANLYRVLDDELNLIDDFTEVLRIEYDVFAIKEIAFAKLRIGHADEALNDFNTVIKNEPKNSSLYSYRGIVKQKMGDLKGALIDYQYASELDKNDLFAKQMVAEIETELKKS
jgi:tetratricopeptide (TPR) repeat protein